MSRNFAAGISFVTGAQNGQLRAVDYNRVSTEEQKKGYGIAVQIRKNGGYIVNKGWVHAGTYKDEGVSGSLEMGSRPDFDRLMADASAHPRPFDVVVVTAGDRIGRTDRAFYRWVWALEDIGVYVAISGRDINNTTPEGRDALRGEADYAFREYERIRQRTQGGIQEKAEEGGHTVGKPRYGYRIEHRGQKGLSRVVPDRCDHGPGCTRVHEFDVLHAARELIVTEGLNVSQTALRLNARGMTTRSGKPWSVRNLWCRLQDACGEPVTIFRNPTRAKLGINGLPLYGETVTIPLDPIFSKEEATELHAAIEKHRRGNGQKRSRNVYPLSRRILSMCGGHYTGVRLEEAHQRAYKCSGKLERHAGAPRCSCRRIVAPAVEAYVWAEICRLMENPSRLVTMADDWLRLSASTSINYGERLADLDRQIAAQEDAIAAVMVTAAKQMNPQRAIEKAIKTLAAERDDLVKMRSDVARWQQEAELAERQAEDLRALARRASGRLHDMDLEEQAQMIELLDLEVRVLGQAPKYRKADCSVTQWFRSRSRPVPVLTDSGWQKAEPIIVEAIQRRRVDRLPDREVLEAALAKARTGERWRTTGHQARYHRWRTDGTWDRLMDALASEPSTPVPPVGALPPLSIRGRLDPRMPLGGDQVTGDPVPTGNGISARLR